MIDVLENVHDQQLTSPTTVRGLPPDLGPLTASAPAPDAAQLDDWRTSYPVRLIELARAWQQPVAWQGMTRIAGIDMPGSGRDPGWRTG
jgi:hypothetical protein